MSDGNIERKKSPEKIKFLLLSNNCVSVFTQDAPLNIQSNIAREHFYSQENYELMFIPSDTKNGKNRVRFDNHG